MSAEKNRSNGAPFCSWEKKFPLDPYVTFNLFPVCFSYLSATSLIANFKSAARRNRDLLGASGNSPKTEREDKTKYTLMGFHCFLLELVYDVLRSNLIKTHCF